MSKIRILASEYPKLSEEWHKDKNGELTPFDVTCGSGKKVWWICDKGHEWEAQIASRVYGHGCPYCSNNKVLSGFNDLATIRPDLASEWNAQKNKELLPTEVAASSNKKVWWICNRGHEWIASINSRFYGNGCPYCSNAKVIKGETDLLSQKPQIAKDWNYIKNGSLTPDNVSIFSGKKVWWICNRGHEWKATISGRSAEGKGCPYCANKKLLPGFNDLHTVNPTLSKEWNKDRNGSLAPKLVLYGSKLKVWWICKEGHEWEASIKERAKGTGCPICSTNRVVPGVNDLKTRYPDLEKEWNYEKNTEIDINQVAPFSSKKAWWICDKGHEWQAVISARAAGRKCPVCSREFSSSFPEQAILYYVSQLFPDSINADKALIGMELDIYIPSKRIAIEYDGYNWHKNNKSEQQKNQKCIEKGIKLIRVREEGLDLYDDCICILRSDRKKDDSLDAVISEILHIVDDSRSLDINVAKDRTSIYEKYLLIQKEHSLKNVAPVLALQWHPEKNGLLKPEMVSYGSKKKVWWLGNCGHEWQATIDERRRGNGCPYCSNHKVLEGFNDLKSINPLLASEWHPVNNGELLPSMITINSNKKIWWLGACDHEWIAAVSWRTAGHNCPYCANKSILPGFNDLQTINPDLANEWHPTLNGNLTPDTIAPKSAKKVWWLGNCGHEWQATVNDRANGTGCPICWKERNRKTYCD